MRILHRNAAQGWTRVRPQGEKMKARWLVFLALAAVSMVCLMGVSASQQRLSVKVPAKPFEVGEDLPRWNWETFDISLLEGVRIQDWNSVKRAAETRPDKDLEYYIDQSELVHLVRNNVFQFSRLGLCTTMQLSFWEYNTSIGYRRWIDRPDAFTLALMLTDAKQDAAREEFAATALRVLNDPQTKLRWNEQRDSFCAMMRDDWNIGPKDPDWVDYNRMLNATYESSMPLAFNALIRIMNATDYSLKVIPDGYYWQMVRVINNFFDYVYDESPMKIQSACYRMGPDATRKLIGYVERARDGFLK